MTIETLPHTNSGEAMQAIHVPTTTPAATGSRAPSTAATVSAYQGYQIIRRNGAVVVFEPNKIAVALMKAFLAVHGTQGAASASVRETVDGLTEAVVRALLRSAAHQGGTGPRRSLPLQHLHQLPPNHLPRRIPRKHPHKMILPRMLVPSQPALQIPPQRSRMHRLPRPSHDKRNRPLPPLLIRHPDHRRVRHRRMLS